MVKTTSEWVETVLIDQLGATLHKGDNGALLYLDGEIVGEIRSNFEPAEFYVAAGFAPPIIENIETLDLIKAGFEAGKIGGEWDVWLDSRYHGYYVTNDTIHDDVDCFCLGKVKHNIV